MNRRVWTGVIAGVLAATVLLAVGIGSYRAGQDDEVVTRTVENGEIVRVVDHGRGFFPGFLFFPVLLVLLLFLVVRGGRRHWYGHGYHGGWGPGPGPGWHGPRRWGPDGPDAYGYGYGYGDDEDGPEARWREWHRRQHEGGASPGPDDRSPGAPGPGTAPDPDPGADPLGLGDPGEPPGPVDPTIRPTA
jgi:hypothetical protein